MRSRLLVLNIALLALIGGAVTVLRQHWMEAREREARLLGLSLKPLPAPVLLVRPMPGSVGASTYLDVASRLLLSRDRNPNVVIESAPEEPMPALPKFYGIMAFDENPFIILAESAGAQQRRYQVGQKVGPFQILKLEPTGLTLQWKAKKVFASFSEMTDRNPVQQAQAPVTGPETGPSVASTVPLTNVSGPVSNRPGSDVTATTKACLPGDSAPNGSVADGYRKIVTQSMFGNQCRWEQIR